MPFVDCCFRHAHWLILAVALPQGKGIAIAVQQLCSLDVQTACHAAAVVANLAACNQVQFHDSLQQAGALAPLVELLKCSLDEQSAALGALRNLTSDTLWQVRLGGHD